MRVLVINGSPRGKGSNTYKLTQAFLEGMGEQEVQELQLNRLLIRPCLGCFSCWNKTPGQCCIQDDMAEVIQKLLWADVTIWSFPLYYFTVPGALKNLIDRQLPMVLPFMTERQDQVGHGSHPARYDMSGKRTVVISTCGFYTAEGNYDGVKSLFDHMCSKGQYTAVLCGQGELFRVKELSQRTNEYLGYVKKAGEEYVSGGISPETKAKLEQLLYPKEVFEAMADASWGVDRESGQREAESLIFTRQMAALYKKESFAGKEQVLEMYYTDLDERYQIVLGREGSRVLTDNFRQFTTRIETPISVWKSIAAGEIRGDVAMSKHLYQVKGDFSLMINWDEYFGGAGSGGGSSQGGTGSSTAFSETSDLHIPRKGTNMNLLLLPWIVFWVAVPIDRFYGSLVSLAVCGLAPIFFYQNKKTVYDVLSGGLVTALSLAALLGASQRITVPLSYLAFGLMWTVSCIRKLPLTAHYSMNDYGGEKAIGNSLFVVTNRILTLAWGILYLCTPVWTYALMGRGISSWVGAINSVLPVLMGLFTAWFQKWYPARVARGGRF